MTQVIEIVPLRAQLVDTLWRIELQLTYSDGSTEQRLYVLPQDTIEWRMAEYEYDPSTDLDEVTEMVLFEAVVTDEPDLSHPDHLYNTASVEQARTRHRQRHRDRRKRLQVKDSTATPVSAPSLAASAAAKLDVRGALQQACPVSDQHLQVKRDYVAQVRDRHRRRQQERSGGRETPSQLYQRLNQTQAQ